MTTFLKPILLFVFLCNFIYAEMTLKPFDKVMDSVILYKTNFYGFQLNSNQFVRMNSKGFVKWSIKKDRQEILDAKIKFEKLFFLNNDGGIELYDIKYGYQIYGTICCAILYNIA